MVAVDQEGLEVSAETGHNRHLAAVVVQSHMVVVEYRRAAWVIGREGAGVGQSMGAAGAAGAADRAEVLVVKQPRGLVDMV